GRFIVITQQMLIVTAAARHCRFQQLLGQDHPGSQSSTVRTVIAFANAIESIAGRNYPGIGGRALQVLAKIFEQSWVFRRKRSKVVDCFIYAGCQACSRYVVAQDSAIDDLREESSLRNELTHQVRD